MATLTNAVGSFAKQGERARAPQGVRKRGILALLTAAGAGAAALARRRSKRRDALPPEPPRPA